MRRVRVHLLALLALAGCGLEVNEKNACRAGRCEYCDEGEWCGDAKTGRLIVDPTLEPAYWESHTETEGGG